MTELECTPAADIFSLALTICTIYDGNIPLIESTQNIETYSKQLTELEKKVGFMSVDMGPNLVEAIQKMVSIDVKLRPSAQLFLLVSSPGHHVSWKAWVKALLCPPEAHLP